MFCPESKQKLPVLLVYLFVCLFCTKPFAARICFEFVPAKGHQPTYEWLKQAKWCWGIEVPYYYSGEKLPELYSQFQKVVVSYDANTKARISEAKYKKRRVYNPHQVFDKHKEVQGGNLSDTIWLGLLENDSAGTRFPQELLMQKPKTHSQARQLIDLHVKNALDFSNKYDKRLKLWGLCGYSQTAHIFADHGVDCVIVERANDDVEDLHTGIAFARGASNQFACQWGIDISLWWGPIYGCVQDMDTSYHRRNLYISYFNGAQVFRIEGGHLFYNQKKKRFSRLKKVIDDFGKFTMRVSPGIAVVPAAIMLADDHGWMTPPYWQTDRTAWNYARIDYRQGQRGIDGIFGMAFPGSVYAMQPFPFGSYLNDNPPASPFALSSIEDYFAPSKEDVYKAQPPLPFGSFKDRNQARQALSQGRKLQADFRPMSDSRWGDVFDVITQKANAQVLDQYQVIILAGQINLTRHLKQKLMTYAKNGGMVIVSAGTAGPDDQDLTGVSFLPELHTARAIKWQHEKWQQDSYLFVPLKDSQNTVTVLAQTDLNKPAAVYYDYGKGGVYTVLTPWFEAGHNDLSVVSRRLLDKVMRSVVPVRVQGLPVEWVTTKMPGQRTVLAANHRNAPWQGDIHLKNPGFKPSKCTELISGKSVKTEKCDYGYKVSIQIPAYDFKIIRWEK